MNGAAWTAIGAALIVLGIGLLAAWWPGRHGRRCGCTSCFERNVSEARRQAYEEGRDR